MKSLALIAHDGKKDEMEAFARGHRRYLSEWRLIGTGTTASVVRDSTGLEIEGFLSGPYGGDVQIAAKVLAGEVEAVFFFTEPSEVHPHDPDIQTLQRICNITNTTIACNPATAELVLAGLKVQK